jgi:hypothetical protein
MFAFEGRVSDKLAVIGVIQPQAIAFGATGVLTAAIDMQDWERVICVAQSGTLGSSGTLDVKAVASATSGGTYAALTGKSATQLVKATDDNKVVVIEVTQDDVAKVEKRYVKINMVAGTANATSGCVVLGVPASYGKASDNDLAAVAEIL